MRRALLIVDHGSRNAAAREATAALCQKVAAARPDWLVEYAHMELAQPDFESGVDALVERGAAEIFVHLHFLGAGFHVQESIPELIGKATDRHPQVRITSSPPLGEDPRITDIIVSRMDDHLGEFGD